MNSPKNEGILLINKPSGKTSFSLVAQLRKILGVRKIGHAGTLDPFATGVMVLLIGRNYTRLSDRFLNTDKQYFATLRLGIATDSHDCDGETIAESDLVPTMEQIDEAIAAFQGELEQIPPMFSAKKIGGKKLYELARKGKTIERASQKIHVKTEFLAYEYPYLSLRFNCSKGTYIRTLAHDIGGMLGCGAHLSQLCREKSGPFKIEDCIDGTLLANPEIKTEIITRLIAA